MKNSIFLMFLSCILLNCNDARKINYLEDYEKGVEQSLQTGRKNAIIFDLYGSSVNYANDLLSDNDIILLLDSFIVTRLRCDDRKMKDSIQTIGEYNSELQIHLTGKAYQPMLCIIDHKNDKNYGQVGFIYKDRVIAFIKASGVPLQEPSDQ